ncbi:MAG: bacillithiol biosynthesis cysteine-adding enzyme BshC [Candidatus Solibacter usitatus]|nr:bacillithiol biosynthesis cysteine-adding enzyme BshC [Candidatus Solibacter usitatus]
MHPACKRHTDLPHTSRLFGDLLYHFDRVSRFYPFQPQDPEAYRKSAASIDFPDARRAALVDALRDQNGDSESLKRLSQRGTVAVVTGQQVGLFSGPAYTLYKALTAARLASRLSEQGIPAVPVFWLATEDHDLAEVSSVWSFRSNHEPLHLTLPHAAESQRPVGGIAIESPPVEALAASLEGFPYGDEIASWVREAYTPGCTYGEAFAALLRKMTSAYGLLFFDPMHAKSRALAAPFIQSAVDAAPDLTAALLERNRELNAAGYHAQVHIEDSTSLFFLIENGERLALRRKDGAYYHKERRIEAAELRDKAASLSPNAALRPVSQDFMMPTVAYIGGPAELAYLAQSAVIYDRLLGRMPVAAPRACFTLFDARSEKLMRRYGLGLESFFDGDHALLERMAAKLVPAEMSAALDAVTTDTLRNLDKLRAATAGFDKTLAAAVGKSASKVEYQLQKIRRKVGRESMRRDRRALDDSAYLYHLLYPRKNLQERVYTILPFLARHGAGLIDQLYESIHVDCPDHHLLYL